MYSEHCTLIAAGMRRDVATFKRGVMFAVLSIRQHVVKVPLQLRDLDRDGADCKWLFGHKRGAYEYMEAHAEELWLSMRRLKRPIEAIATMTRVPGLGIAKAAFVCQLMGFNVGCLDGRNLARFGLPPRQYRSDGERGKNTLAFARKIAAYCEVYEGRAQELWDDWCEDVANEYGYDAHDISALHLACLPKIDRQPEEIPF